MKKKLVLALLLISVVLLSLVTLVFGQVALAPADQAATKKITIVDSLGRTVRVPCPPKRIVAMGGSYGPETLLAFGVLDKIVGVTDSAKNGEILNSSSKKYPM